MAHQQQRALEVEQHRLEQLERLDVEVVGRLVEHQQVERPREEPRQQQPVALAARQHAHRGARAFRRKEKVLQVAHHMLAGAVDLDVLGAVADVLQHGAIGIELLAQLVEVGDLEIGPEPDAAGVGDELAEQQPEQRRLPAAVRPDQADAIRRA